jgi:hypothetical protein
VCAAFRLPHEGLSKAGLLQNLERLFNALAREGKRALLFVDEAQNLSARAVEELRMLSNFQVGERWMMQTFLLGQPEFRAILQSPELHQLRQRVIAQYHLGPLDETETRAYVEHRLRHVGWTADPSFDDGSFREIHAFTGGIPRRINTLCDRVLLAAYLEERHAVSQADVREVSREIVSELGLDQAQAIEPAVPGLDALASPGAGAAYARAHAGEAAVDDGDGAAAAAARGRAETAASVHPLHPVVPPAGTSVSVAEADLFAQLERALAQALDLLRVIRAKQSKKSGT